MGPVIAIRSKDTDKILEVTADYYRQFNLELTELGIGSRQSKYITLGKRYANWQAFLEAIRYGSAFQMNDVTTFLDVYGNVNGSEDWTIIEYRHTNARYNLSPDDKLAETLSRNLNIKVINFYDDCYDTGYYSILVYNNGILEDVLDFEGNMLNEAKGFFENRMRRYNQLSEEEDKLDIDDRKNEEALDKIDAEKSDELHTALDSYLDNLKLNLDVLDNLMTYDCDKHCRRFLLKGDPLALQKYLKIEKMGTLDLNPLKGL